MNRIERGKNIAITWLLYENNGEVHNLEGKELELYMTCGGFKYPVTDYTVTENAIAWTFQARMQTKTGYYKLVLLEKDNNLGLHSFDVREAFCLEPEGELENIETIAREDCSIVIRSVLTYAHITNLASIDTVESKDGSGTTVVVHLTNGKSFALPFGTGGSGSNAGGDSNYVLPAATASKLGGVRVGFAKSGNRYPVRLDSMNNAYVEVPSSGISSGNGSDSESGNNEGSGGVTHVPQIYFCTSEGLPDFERSDGLYYFDTDSGLYGMVPSAGDYIWSLADYGFISIWKVSHVTANEYAGGYTVAGQMIVDQLDIFVPKVEDSLDSHYKDIPLSANQGRVLKEMIQGFDAGTGGSGSTGRSISNVQNWFKLCADESVQATPMNIADPSSSAGGSWSQTAGSPTAEYPYLRCFMQINYDSPLESGYTYTRSSAFTARYFNSDSSQEYNNLQAALEALRSELKDDLTRYESDLDTLNTALERLRSTVQGSITNQLSELQERFKSILGTDVELIMNNGLWAVLTSWTNDTGNKKAFADIVLNAENARALIQTGSTFFDHQVGGSVTLDGILGQIAAKVTRQDVNSLIASAQFSLDPSSLNSVISKSQACWKKNGILYPYDLYLIDYINNNSSATLADYETYMTAATGGPSGDASRPAGPFELVVVVEQFSSIQQAVDAISASVDATKYMWQNGNYYASYDAFESDYEDRASAYSSYTYEQFVKNVLGYAKVEVGTALSNITQTSGEIKSILGDVGYFWRKLTPVIANGSASSGYSYQAYAIPLNKTRDEYVTEMQSAGWELVSYASKMSVIDQFPDSITSLVKNSTLVWVNESATGAAYCRDYDYWFNEYNIAYRTVPYEEYVSINYPAYELTVVTDSFSRIKQTADSVGSAVQAISGHETRLSNIEQTADKISLAVSKSSKCWKDNLDGTVYEYSEFVDDYEDTSTLLDYEDWVKNVKNCTLIDVFMEISGIKVQSDKIWAGVGDGDDVKASILIIANADVDDDTRSKIILDAGNVIINGGLSAGVVTAEAIASKAITAEKIAANSVDASKIQAGAITADKIAAGVLNTAIANVLNTLTVGTYSKIKLEGGFIRVYDSSNNLRMQIGQGSSDSAPVLKFFDAAGNFLYDLGPNGIEWASDDSQYDDCYFGERTVLGKLCNFGDTVSAINANGEAANVRNAYYRFTPAIKSKTGVPNQYYNYDGKEGDGVSGHGWVSAETIAPYNGLLVKTDNTYSLRPNGANAEMDVWPRIPTSILLDKLSDGWYLDNTDGFLSSYRGTID